MIVEELKVLPVTPIERHVKAYGDYLDWDYGNAVMDSDEYRHFLSCLPDFRPEGMDVNDTASQSMAYVNSRAKGSPHNLEEWLSVHTEDTLYKQTEDEYIFREWNIASSRSSRYFPAHWHSSEYFDIYYVYAGNPIVHFLHQTISLAPGDVLFIAPNLLHGEELPHDEDIMQSTAIRSSTFHSTFLDTVEENTFLHAFFLRTLASPDDDGFIIFHTAGDRNLEGLFFMLLNECDRSASYQRSMTNALMNMIFATILRYHESDMEIPGTRGFKWKAEYSEIFSYMEQHVLSVNIEELADRFHYSPRQIMRIIEKTTGERFSMLVKKRKMLKAAEYLADTDLSVERISELVGYENPTSFTRAFHEAYGMSPREYKKSFR